jgi:nitroreductase
MTILEHTTDETWRLHEEEFWDLKTPEARSRFLISYAVLAPSRLNTQPWLFSVERDRINLFADRRRCLAVVDPEDRQLTISCGAALHNLVVAMNRFGHRPEILTFPDLNRPDLLATVRWGRRREPSVSIMREFRSMLHRRTRPALGNSGYIQDTALEELQALARGEGIELEMPRNSDIRKTISELVQSAAEEQFLDYRFQREHASWTHPNRRRSRDGIPGRLFDPALRRGRSASAAGRGETYQELFASDAALGILTARNDSHAAWLQTGCALQRVLLGATERNLQATFLNQPLELEHYRSRVNQVTQPGRMAQVMMLFGHSHFVRPTPRRGLETVLLSED